MNHNSRNLFRETIISRVFETIEHGVDLVIFSVETRNKFIDYTRTSKSMKIHENSSKSSTIRVFADAIVD